jgi:hypothetical protein
MGCSSQPEVKTNQQPQQQQQQQQNVNNQQEQFDQEVEKYISDMKNGTMLLGNEDNTFIQNTNTMATMIRTTYSQKNKMNQMEKTTFNQMKNMAIQQINQYKTNKVQGRNTLIQSYQTMLNKVGPNSRLGKEVSNFIQELNNQNKKLNQFCQGLVNEYQKMVV